MPSLADRVNAPERHCLNCKYGLWLLVLLPLGVIVYYVKKAIRAA